MNDKLNLQDLTDGLAESHGMSRRNAESFVRDFFVLIAEALEKDKYVKVKGLGTFKLIEVDARESVDVNTGEHIEIQGHNRVTFTPDPTLKDAVNKPFSVFETVVLEDAPAADSQPAEEKQAVEERAAVEEKPIDVRPAEEQQPADEQQSVKEGQSSEDTPIEPNEPIEPNTPTEPNKPIEPITPTESIEPTPSTPPIEPAAPQPTPSASVEQLRISEKKRKEIAKKAETSSTPFFAIIAIIIILGCIGFVAYLYYPDFADSQDNEPAQQTELTQPADTIGLQQEQALGQSSADAASTEQASSASAQPSSSSASTAAQGATTPQPADGGTVQKLTAGQQYQPDGVLATYTVKRGESLSDISNHFYGSRSFYTYIVSFNRDKIKNPDSVPVGTVLQIPRLVSK